MCSRFATAGLESFEMEALRVLLEKRNISAGKGKDLINSAWCCGIHCSSGDSSRVLNIS